MNRRLYAPLYRAGGPSQPACRRSRAPDAQAPVPITMRDLWLVLPTALAGVGLVHGLEYHLGLGDTAGHMLAACPLRGGLLLIALFIMATVLVVWREVRSLVAEYRTLAWAAAAARATPAAHQELPRRPARLVALLIAIFLSQVAAYALAQHLWPMSTLMWMNGGLMHMPIDGALPLLPVQCAVSAFMALAIWRLERQVAVLRADIAHLLGVLCQLTADAQAQAIACRGFAPARPPAGLLGFSRPPPLSRG